MKCVPVLLVLLLGLPAFGDDRWPGSGGSGGTAGLPLLGSDWGGGLDAAHAIASKNCGGTPRCFPTVQEAIDDVEARAPGAAVRFVYVTPGLFNENVAWTETNGDSYLIGQPYCSRWDTAFQTGPKIQGLDNSTDDATVALVGSGGIRGICIYRGLDDGDVALDLVGTGDSGFHMIEDTFIAGAFSTPDIADGHLVRTGAGISGLPVFVNSWLRGSSFSDESDDGATGSLILHEGNQPFEDIEFHNSYISAACVSNCDGVDDTPALIEMTSTTGTNSEVKILGISILEVGSDVAVLKATGDAGRVVIGPGVRINGNVASGGTLHNITSAQSTTEIWMQGGVLDLRDFDVIGATANDPGFEGVVDIIYDADAAPESSLCTDESAGSTAHNLDETHANQLYVCEGATAGWVGK